STFHNRARSLSPKPAAASVLPSGLKARHSTGASYSKTARIFGGATVRSYTSALVPSLPGPAPAAARSPPSGLTTAKVPAPRSLHRSRGGRTSQTVTVASAQLLTTQSPFGLTATLLISAKCGAKTPSLAPVRPFQRITVSSVPPETSSGASRGPPN